MSVRANKLSADGHPDETSGLFMFVSTNVNSSQEDEGVWFDQQLVTNVLINVSKYKTRSVVPIITASNQTAASDTTSSHVQLQFTFKPHCSYL